ncbi:hypothetical protein NDU88_008138 [Pleurodeles waltl]|uniref:Uncharacterized protein n=1 Tax=Pleurodeles waltl TaxID=8319 RepID=A0AAV7PNF6_PLEWA|nr:hypothetical protein NDU88_008138 [Pleurodeles waltl]
MLGALRLPSCRGFVMGLTRSVEHPSIEKQSCPKNTPPHSEGDYYILNEPEGHMPTLDAKLDCILEAINVSSKILEGNIDNMVIDLGIPSDAHSFLADKVKKNEYDFNEMNPTVEELKNK